MILPWHQRSKSQCCESSIWHSALSWYIYMLELKALELETNKSGHFKTKFFNRSHVKVWILYDSQHIDLGAYFCTGLHLKWIFNVISIYISSHWAFYCNIVMSLTRLYLLSTGNLFLYIVRKSVGIFFHKLLCLKLVATVLFFNRL